MQISCMLQRTKHNILQVGFSDSISCPVGHAAVALDLSDPAMKAVQLQRAAALLR